MPDIYNYSDGRRIVVKLGSDIVEKPIVEEIARQTSNLIKDQNKQILIVSSGAIKHGRQVVSISGSQDLPSKQAYAAIGQPLIMKLYEKAFQEYNLPVAQCLFTREDLAPETSRYQNSVSTLEVLLNNKVVPIANENDTVAVEEIKFGDNDYLAALVAKAIHADMLIFLSTVQGFYMEDALVNEVLPDEIEGLKKYCTAEKNPNGTGSMASKIGAAQIAVDAGIYAAIASGQTNDIITKVLNGYDKCTYFKKKNK